MTKDAIEVAEKMGELMLDTLKEHGRDYDNSKAEIVDFFLTLCGGRQKINCPYTVGERIEYLSFRRKRWIGARVLQLRGAAEWNNWTPSEIHLELEIKDSTGHLQTRVIRHVDKWNEVMRLRKVKEGNKKN